MFFGIPQPYIIDIYGFYFEEYMPGYLVVKRRMSRLHKFFMLEASQSFRYKGYTSKKTPQN